MDFPKGVIGLLGDANSGVAELLRQAASATVYDYTLDSADAFGRWRAEAEIERLRRAGSTVVLASHHPQLLERSADEVWWIQDGTVIMRGYPSEVLQAYAGHTAKRFRSGELRAPDLAPSLRRGDGRAEIKSLGTLDENAEPASVWESGKHVSIKVSVGYAAAVSHPVIGIMIRTRIGFEVYGTNTELEGVPVGPCQAGDTRIVTFTFLCGLCAQHYTITAASHDPDGVWHDWMEDAVAISVVDTRYTAGVANLRARVTCSRE